MTSETFYRIAPEAPGFLAPDSDLDITTLPPMVADAHIVLDDWFGDGLLEVYPVFFITPRALAVLEEIRATKYKTLPLRVSVSPEFLERQGEVQLPSFVRLVPLGKAGVDDVAVGSDNALIMSGRALDALSDEMQHADIKALEEPSAP